MAVSADNMKYDHLFKVVMVGNSGAGKSPILDRFAKDKVESTYTSTIGVDFAHKIIQVEGYAIKLQIWDTTGLEQHRSIISAYYRGSNVIMAVAGIKPGETAQGFTARAKSEFDIWLQNIRNCGSNLPVFLVINWADRIKSPRDKTIIRDAMQNYAQQNNVNQKIFFVSAQTGEKLEELFSDAGRVGLQKTGVRNRSAVGSLLGALWRGAKALFNAVIGGVLIGIAELFIANPLSLTFHILTSSKLKVWEKLIYTLTSPLVTVDAEVFYACTAAKKAWKNGLVDAFAWYGKVLQKEGDAKTNFNHVIASWLVLGITAAVVLAIIFPPAWLAAMIPSIAASVGLSGVSTALLAVIAGVATATVLSIAYGLGNLVFGGDAVKAQQSDDSDSGDEETDEDESPDQILGQMQHPAAAPGLASDDVSYARLMVGSPQTGDRSNVQPPASGQTHTFASNSH